LGVLVNNFATKNKQQNENMSSVEPPSLTVTCLHATFPSFSHSSLNSARPQKCHVT